MHFFTRGVTISAVGKACKSPDVPLDTLTRQKALFDGLFARVPEAIVLLDTDERILQVNPEFTRLFGYAQEEACGRLINELVVPEELLAEAEEYTRRGFRGESVDVEAVRKHKDGTRVHVSIVSGPVSVAGSQIAEYVIYRDITERKRAEQRLCESEAYLAEAQRLSQTGSWAWDPAAGDIRYWSETCYRVLGFDPAGPLPRFEEFFHRLHPDDQAESWERFERAIRDKSDFELDYRVVHPEKGIRHIHAVGHAVLDGSGNLGEFVGTVIDVTERKRAEQELRQREADLRTKNDRLKLLLNVTNQINLNLELREVLRSISSNIREVMHCDAVFVSLVDSASGKPRLYVLDFPYGKGLIKEETVYTISGAGKRVLETLKPSVVDVSDPAAVPPEIYNKVIAEGLKSACLIPLVNRGRVLGGLVIARKTEASFTPDDLEFLAQVSGQIAIAVENALAFQEVSGLRDRLQLLLNLTTKITSTLDLREVLRAVAANVRELIHADAATVSLPDATSGKFRLFAVDFPHGRGGIKEELLYTPGAASRKAADTMKPVVGYAPELDERESSEVRDIAAAEGMKAFCLIPLVTRGRFLGILSILRTTETPFTPQDVDLLTQASGQIAIAVENALAYHEISELKDKLAQEKLYLEEEEKKLRRVFETMPTMVWIAGADGGNEFGNRQWQEYTGLSDEKTVGSGWQDAVYPTDLKQHWEKWCASRAIGEPFENEVRYRRAADGQYRWFLSRAVPLRDGKGNIVRWYGVSTDIEDRKRAESLLAGEKRILEMVAKGDSLTEILDALCQFVEEQANGVLASVLLLDEGRLRNGGAPSLSKAYADAIDGTVVGPSAGSCGTAAYRGEQVIVEDIATDPLWANYRELALPHSLRACWSTPIFSSQGKVIATFAMYYREPRRPSKRDQEIIEQITHLAGVAIERKLTQDKLQRSEAYLTEAERVAHTGSWAYDPTAQKALYWSDEMFRIYGFDPHQGPPTSEAFLERVHPEDRESVDNTMRNAAQERTEYRVEHRIILPNGTIRHIHAVGHPVLDRSGNAVEFVGSAVDITDVKRAEEEREKLRQLEADLAHINRINMMGELAASLAHEIKQPIGAATTSASACLRWLAHDPPDLERARGAAMRVEQEGNRAADVINGLRSFYKKGAPPEREVIDVNAIVGEMIVLLRNEAVRHSVTIHPELAAYVPKILADRVQLQQVFMNLMLNAIEAMKHTGGELTITSRLDQQGQLTISVSDTGVGLPTEGTERIFDAFYTTKPQGTGMGLAISRSIVESHGGRLWATGNEKAGATFHFTLRNEAEAHA